jgi:hypothetical protein
MLISDGYRQLNAAIHDKAPTWGVMPWVNIKFVKHLCEKTTIESILDYGCGKGRLGKVLSGVQSYDPAVPEFSLPPKPADLVVCTSVLEHVEPEALDSVLDELKFLTWKMIYLVVSCIPSRHVLPDGRNAHLIQKPLEWWLPRLTAHWKIKCIDVNDERDTFTFVGRT